ncbi:MAG: ABC transporter ATP-binding protein [Nitrososphaerota archaeon]|nr:ABC transporter ATP-binding protein [Nitrososphaerota archaeon]
MPAIQSEPQKDTIEVDDLSKRYGTGPEAVMALRGVTFSVAKGEFVSISGPSGSGKSTLLNALGGLDRPTSGRVRIDGIDLARLPSVSLARVRNRKIGFVFQDFYLLPRNTTLENVELPMSIGDVPPRERRKRAAALLQQFGLSDKLKARPNELSGGQRQRVALARALANDPSIVLADEPTGNLDSKNARLTMDTLKKLNSEFGKTLVVITHDPDVASQAERTIYMLDGAIEKIVSN